MLIEEVFLRIFSMVMVCFWVDRKVLSIWVDFVDGEWFEWGCWLGVVGLLVIWVVVCLEGEVELVDDE